MVSTEMVSTEKPTFPVRTAVLVVHGMGIQRPLDTVRHIVNAIWLDVNKQNKVWMHPERSAVDIDLPVITTSPIPGVTPERSVDFHELYWSHLMSETRAVAVLLWLFELARKGPRLKPNMRLVWWAGALILVLLMLSVSFLGLETIARLADVQMHPDSILIAPALMFLILFVLSATLFFWNRAWVFVGFSVVLGGICAALFASEPVQSGKFVGQILPALVATMATWVTMGPWGLAVLLVAYILSFVFELLVHLRLGTLASTPLADLLPWAMTSSWCVVAACVIVATYVVLSAVFLQPFIGDAARYFRNDPSNVAVRREIRRQAVATLEALHLSQRYDRIVVVAHSLGSVIAYDMLRAYFGRIARNLPTDQGALAAKIAKVDGGTLTAQGLRAAGREIIGEMASTAGGDGSKTWLVTDFVTLGSPLTHGHYLLCRGDSAKALVEDFNRRIEEREFPVCPPAAGGDKLLTYDCNSKRYFHIAAMFGLTRWTNLYFPVTELFRGDPIGGPLKEVFGPGICDVAVNLGRPAATGLSARIAFWAESLFSHQAYWIVPTGAPDAPHLIALRHAIDLDDSGIANDQQSFATP
jgi:hypothetical protein